MMRQILHQRLTMSKTTQNYQPCQSEQEGAVANLTTSPPRSQSKLSKMWQRVKRVFIRRNCSAVNPILDALDGGGEDSVPTARDTSIVTLMSPPHASNERLMMTESGGRYVPSSMELQLLDSGEPTFYTIKTGDIPELDMRDKVHAWIVHLQNPTPGNFAAALKQISKAKRPNSPY